MVSQPRRRIVRPTGGLRNHSDWANLPIIQPAAAASAPQVFNLFWIDSYVSRSVHKSVHHAAAQNLLAAGADTASVASQLWGYSRFMAVSIRESYGEPNRQPHSRPHSQPDHQPNGKPHGLRGKGVGGGPFKGDVRVLWVPEL